MLFKKNRHRVLPTPPPSPNLHSYLASELEAMDYNLSQPTCQFVIHPVIIPRADSFTIQLYIRPRVGIFQWVQFRVRVVVDATGNARRHKMYNDRRVLHPNIHVETCQIIYPQLVREWNPTTPICNLFMHLKHTILEPNLMFVPNTHFNRKAACAYHFKRSQYPTLMQQLSPLYLQDYINMQFINSMQAQQTQVQFWSIQQLQRKTKPTQDRQWQTLAKRIKTLDLQQPQYNHKSSHRQSNQQQIEQQQDNSYNSQQTKMEIQLSIN